MSAIKKASKANLFIAFLSLAALVFIGIGFVKLNFRPKLSTNYITDFSGIYDKIADRGYFFGREFNIPAEINIAGMPVLGVTNSNEKWIEIDLSEQKLKAWDGNNLFLESLVSTGLPYFPTPQGEFRIWYKIRYTRMKGGEGRYAYNLPNVPYTMFFENDKVPSWRGYGLHGTYWHSDFGKVHSHGCVNLQLQF